MPIDPRTKQAAISNRHRKHGLSRYDCWNDCSDRGDDAGAADRRDSFGLLQSRICRARLGHERLRAARPHPDRRGSRCCWSRGGKDPSTRRAQQSVCPSYVVRQRRDRKIGLEQFSDGQDQLREFPLADLLEDRRRGRRCRYRRARCRWPHRRQIFACRPAFWWPLLSSGRSGARCRGPGERPGDALPRRNQRDQRRSAASPRRDGVPAVGAGRCSIRRDIGTVIQ